MRAAKQRKNHVTLKYFLHMSSYLLISFCLVGTPFALLRSAVLLMIFQFCLGLHLSHSFNRDGKCCHSTGTSGPKGMIQPSRSLTTPLARSLCSRDASHC